ncbi:MAG: hypothetical protein IJT27_04910 [Clostridia bacterium]|nr:hypothetical protein [Clostridia bacterium]
MNIVIKNEYRVEAELTDEELQSLGIRFEQLDYADIETRRVIQTLLGEMRDAGVNVSLSGRVLIEAHKLPDGCRFCFSVLPPRTDGAPSVKQLIKRPRVPLLFVCASRQDADRCLACLTDAAQTRVYEAEGRILIYVSGDVMETSLSRAAEFGDAYPADGELLPAFLNEQLAH